MEEIKIPPFESKFVEQGDYVIIRLPSRYSKLLKNVKKEERFIFDIIAKPMMMNTAR